MVLERRTFGNSRARLGFGLFEIDLDRLELTKNGMLVSIQLVPLRVLVQLLENANHLVTKQELLSSVWAHEHVVPEVLTTAIRSLRRVLGDDAGQPRYVQTVHRRGYRLIPRVTRLEEWFHQSSVPSAACEEPCRATDRGCINDCLWSCDVCAGSPCVQANASSARVVTSAFRNTDAR